MNRIARIFSGSAGATLLAVALAGDARAEVERRGDWSADPVVDLDVSDVTRAEALRLVAKEAGLSLVTEELPPGTIDLAIDDQPFGRIVEAILTGGDYVVKREGTLVHVAPRRDGDAKPAAPSSTSTPSTGDGPGRGLVKDGNDVTVMGQRANIGPDDVVDDVTVMGGSIDIEGHVTGDLSVMGGSATLKKGARVDGDALAMGGVLTVEEGVEISGDLGVLGGVLRGAEHAKVKGSVNTVGSEGEDHGGKSLAERFTNATLLFLLGVIFFALASSRMEAVRGEIVTRPMRSLALGILAPILALIAIVCASITIIGIPFAALGAIVGVLLAMAGTAAALGVAGKMLYGHKSQNPYVHLAVGCALFFLVGLVPVLGGMMQLGTVLIGIGAIVTTRGGGLLGSRKSDPTLHPYR